ncbi:hypothetical protein PENANT_c123G05226, partial [Penicillium antarcticum]
MAPNEPDASVYLSLNLSYQRLAMKSETAVPKLEVHQVKMDDRIDGNIM